MSQAEILKNLSYDDYVRLPGVRVSDLVKFRKSCLHARYDMLNPSGDTPSTVIGTAVHACILEPKKFLSDYAVAPKLDKRTTAGKAQWAQWQLDNAGSKIVLGFDDWNVVRAMTAAVIEHPAVLPIINLPSLRETVVTWSEPVRGEGTEPVSCKARIDWIVKLNETFVVDIKSCRDASANEFARSISRYRYHVQAASYLRALQAAAPQTGTRRFLWVCVENTAPYGVAVYEPGDGLLEQGAVEYQNFVQQFALCSAINHWPGYPEMITPIDLPKWDWSSDEVQS